MKKLLTVLSMAALFSLAALAADVTGQWKVQGGDKTAPQQLVLQVNKGFVTGTIDGVAIEKGGVAGDTVFFEAVRGGVRFTYKGEMKGTEIQLREAGPKLRTFTYTRSR